MSLHPDCLQQIILAIGDVRPRTLLVVGPDGQRILKALPDFKEPNLHLAERESWREQIALAGRCDIAVVAGIIEIMPKPEARALLATLRDCHSQTCLVAVGDEWASEFWTREEFIALGFSLKAQGEPNWFLYGFNLATYKSTPDWLSGRYWANPELWNKHRW